MNKTDIILLRSSGSSIWELIDAYRDLVNNCLDGYGWTSYELDDELSVRDKINNVLDNKDFPQDTSEKIKREVHLIDESLIGLFQPNVLRRNESSKWWHRGVLQYAGEQYIDCMRCLGIVVNHPPGWEIAQ